MEHGMESMQMGMAGTLETQCGQSFGADQFHKLGNYAYYAVVSSHFKQCSNIYPMGLHGPIGYSFGCFNLDLNKMGQPYPLEISYWLTVILFLHYIKYSLACQKYKLVLGTNALRSSKEFFFLAIPSALTVCSTLMDTVLSGGHLSWLVILAGLLTNPKLETLVLSICLDICTLHYFIPYGIGAEVSNEMEIVHYVTNILPLLCLSVSVDGFRGILCGKSLCELHHSDCAINIHIEKGITQ
ncbi:hypothetical protein VNO77_21640 [Canavalia gladiata]|uniref:Uncharacterized protein n=1 Tax=Canavalia gladiata TaxID=3824 RepID=A0AAN9QMI8_CANGL